MIIFIASDHRGAELKARLTGFAKDMGYEVTDLTPVVSPDDDYPDAARLVAEKVAMDTVTTRGILICGSGAGVDIVANKFAGVRSVLGLSPDQVYDARHDDNVNVISLAAGFTLPEDAERMLQVFLRTPFGGEERLVRRLNKIRNIELGWQK